MSFGVYTTEKALKDAEGKISDDIKKGVQEKVEELKKVKDKDDISAIKAATENLSKEIQKIGEYMQKNPTPKASEPKETKKEESKPSDSAKASPDKPEENK